MNRARTRINFAVDVQDLGPSEFIMASGSCEELGNWDPQSALPLTPDEERKNRWRGFIQTSETLVKFRYFIAYKLCGDHGERTIIGRWETFLQPRSVLVSAEHRNGECRRGHVDLFGYHAGHRLLSDGWLQHDDETQILLRVHGKALKFYKTAKERKNCRIRIIPFDVRHKQPGGSFSLSHASSLDEEEEEEDSVVAAQPYPSHSECYYAVLSNSNPRYEHQTVNGVQFNNNKDYVVFKTHSVAEEFLAFQVEIFSEESKRIGACYALPSSLSDSFGSTQLPFINSSGRPIGQIRLEYLFIRNIKRQIPFQSMEVSYTRHWKKRNTVEVGHRGAGNSYTKFAMARENTVHSLNTAAKNGADYVEFDVQLTKDKIPVIYHDFHVLVSVAKRGLTAARSDEQMNGIDFHEIAVKDLKLSQMKLLMLEHVSKRDKPDHPVSESEEEDLKPFPTLFEALSKVDRDVGFNVEVKYPMMQANGEHECDHYFERNEFVDIVLSVILNNAKDRRIVFSSFDPDICSLISTKQNRYPILFLCVGETLRYTPFSDQRSSTSLTAVNFAAGADLLGVNFNSEDLLKDPFPVKRASELGLVSFVWGDDLDKKETINYFKKELGVNGLIYDRIGEIERRRNVFIVEREQKRAIFLASSGHNTPRPLSPADSETSITSPVKSENGLGLDMHNLHIQPPMLQTSQS